MRKNQPFVPERGPWGEYIFGVFRKISLLEQQPRRKRERETDGDGASLS